MFDRKLGESDQLHELRRQMSNAADQKQNNWKQGMSVARVQVPSCKRRNRTFTIKEERYITRSSRLKASLCLSELIDKTGGMICLEHKALPLLRKG